MSVINAWSKIKMACDEFKAHPETFLPPWVIEEMRNINRNKAYFEAHVDEIVNSMLQCIFPPEGCFSIVPQARQKERLAWQITDTSVLGNDNTECEDISLTGSGESVDPYSNSELIQPPEEPSSLPEFHPLPAVPLGPLGLLNATMDNRIHNSRIIPTVEDRFHRLVAAHRKDGKQSIPEFHVYALQGTERERKTLVVVEDNWWQPQKSSSENICTIFSHRTLVLLAWAYALLGPEESR
ncbi:hypothetical protein BT96DRAFT_950373 [Gymnopus androsaceus JB14]|uniref:Uncharacterized protein n=1 Tax=Gymnopus androsaceus JB14 TaxID=1447944 RepID=A0A6A4GGR5_9AGAR|nr:hypothetical protein BT96DRAFT_950373 [Gymnopus androsaceus JB14]